jgi:hypothetical protein
MAPKAKTPQNDSTGVIIRKPNRKHVFVQIRGTTPLITHAWSPATIDGLQAKHEGKEVVGPREKKDPIKDFVDSLYFMPGSKFEDPKPRFALKAIAFKASMVRSSKGLPGMTMTDARLMFFVMGEEDHEFVEIKGTPRNRRDMVRLSGIDRKPDVRFRGEFPTWETVLRIGYDADFTNVESIINLVALAGFKVGVGERRADTEGNTFGQWEVVGYQEV